jgi:hypothetical protein
MIKLLDKHYITIVNILATISTIYIIIFTYLNKTWMIEGINTSYTEYLIVVILVAFVLGSFIWFMLWLMLGMILEVFGPPSNDTGHGP